MKYAVADYERGRYAVVESLYEAAMLMRGLTSCHVTLVVDDDEAFEWVQHLLVPTVRPTLEYLMGLKVIGGRRVAWTAGHGTSL